MLEKGNGPKSEWDKGGNGRMKEAISITDECDEIGRVVIYV